MNAPTPKYWKKLRAAFMADYEQFAINSLTPDRGYPIPVDNLHEFCEELIDSQGAPVKEGCYNFRGCVNCTDDFPYAVTKWAATYVCPDKNTGEMMATFAGATSPNPLNILYGEWQKSAKAESCKKP